MARIKVIRTIVVEGDAEYVQKVLGKSALTPGLVFGNKQQDKYGVCAGNYIEETARSICGMSTSVADEKENPFVTAPESSNG